MIRTIVVFLIKYVKFIIDFCNNVLREYVNCVILYRKFEGDIMSNYLVSVILPIYNVEKYIKKALDSVINQTLKEIEIICVNDCTPDKSFEIVKEYALKDNRFVLIEQETNLGQGVARNKALEIASGEFIMFLDPDDWLELDACEVMYKSAIENNANVVQGCFNKIFQNEIDNKYKFSDIEILNKKYSLSLMQNSFIDIRTFYNVISNPIDYGLEPCWKLFKNSFLKLNNISFCSCRRAEDHPFMIDVRLCSQVYTLDKIVYNYYIREDSSRIYESQYELVAQAVNCLTEKHCNDIDAKT